jgi:hypothetical protein
MKSLPSVENINGLYTLFVDNKSFTALAGELHNSSASNLEYMEKSVWPYLKDLNMNTVVIPTYWEKIEPIKDKFEFTLVDGIINQARENGMKIILLWFGLWKNGISSYVPEWIKTDETYFRICNADGRPMDVISPLCEKAVEADKKAFVKLMNHIKEIDSEEQTVIMLQVENEMGLLGSDRDYSTIANEEYLKEIPNSMKELYGVTGIWEDAFGEDAPEYFMEYYYAIAIEKIASAGRFVYGLPMYVNAWIEKYPWRAGGYPSGGPIARFIKLWRKLAPSIFACAPDIYTSDFAHVCDEFSTSDNPLLIPEIRRDVFNTSNVFYAIGHYNALCYSPFGIEDFNTPPELITGICAPALMKTLNIDVSAWDCTNTAKYLGKAYEMLSNLMELIRKCREEGKLYSFIKKDEYEKGCVIPLKECDIKISYQSSKDVPKSSGMVLEVSDNEFYILGTSFGYSMLPKKNENKTVGILNLEEGEYINNEWIPSRVLNGDERYFTNILDMPSINRVKVYKY